MFSNGLLKYSEENKHSPKREKGHNKVLINTITIFLCQIPKNLICSTIKHTETNNKLHKEYELKCFLLKDCRIYSFFNDENMI